MCKVTVKKVEKFLKGATGEKDGNPWELHVFKCLVSVDGSDKAAVRTCKTFDSGIAAQLKALDEGRELSFEAKPEGDAAPFDFLLVPERKEKARTAGGSRSSGETNRQAALRLAAELAKIRAQVEGSAPSASELLEDADKLLVWLEGGAR